MKGQYLNLLKTIWKFAEGMRVKFIITYAMFVFANLVRLGEPYFLGKFINSLQQGGEKIIANSAFYLGILILLSFAFWLFHGPARCMEKVMAFNIRTNFLNRMFNVITKLPLKWHKDNHSGGTIDRVGKAAHALFDFMDEAYIYIESIIPLIGSIIAIIFIMGMDGLYILIFGIVVFFIIFKFDAFLTWSLSEINKKEHRVASVFFDYISNITTIITLRLEDLAKSEYMRRIRTIFPLFKKRTVINETKWFVVDSIMMIAAFCILLLYIYRSYSMTGVVMVGTVVMLYGYVDKFIDVFYGVAWKYEKLVMTSINLMAVNPILESYANFYSADTVKGISKDWREIQIRELYFKHEDEQHKIHNLENINIDLKRGGRVAFVGESGSGKSTLMTILRGLTVANRIRMRVDGKDMNDLRVLSGATTLIPQDPEIFENTIEYNVTMGILYRNDDMKRAVQIACFDKVIAKLPKGFAADIREKGVNMSGGEKQRLALARGIFAAHDSTLVLLDEPTSSVDSTNELKIYENLFNAFGNKCIVSTVHRLHLLKMFDYIYVFENGKIVEEGRYDELMAKEKGHLRTQWKNYQR